MGGGCFCKLSLGEVGGVFVVWVVGVVWFCESVLGEWWILIFDFYYSVIVFIKYNLRSKFFRWEVSWEKIYGYFRVFLFCI